MHFERGMAAVVQERWTAAVEAFDESIRLLPTQTAFFNRALCLRLLGRDSAAAAAFEEILDRYGTDIDPSRQAEIQRELASLRLRVGRIAVRVQGHRGATVLLDGEEVGRVPLPRALAVSPGSHRLVVRAEGFDDFVREISIIEGREQEVEVTLTRTAAPGRIRLNLAVPGAEVRIDDRPVGTTPLDGPLTTSAGSRTVDASRPGYQTARVQVQVPEGGEAVAELILVPLPNLPPELVGRLDVRLDEDDAEVLLDGHPFDGDTVPIGPHHLEVRLEGHEPFTRDFEVGRGATSTVEVDLQPLPGHQPAGGGSRRFRIAAWVLSGVAVVALGAGLGVALWNNGRFDDWETEDSAIRQAYSSTETEPADADALWDRAQSNAELGDSIGSTGGTAWVLMGTGLATAVAAVVLFIVGSRTGNDTTALLLPRPGGLTLSTSWTTR